MYTKGKNSWTVEQCKAMGFRVQCGGTIICWTDNEEYHPDLSLEEREANARLIAAAPELLKACKYVVKYHRDHDSGNGELFGLDFVTTCIAAIASAESK